MTGGGVGFGAGVGGAGGATGRGGIPGGRPAVRQGEPSPRMVGRGNGIVGTPGGSGAWTGATGVGGAADSVTAGPPSSVGAAGAGADAPLDSVRTGEAVLRETGEAGFFTGEEAARGRVALVDGFALAFGPVARPFCFERPVALRSAPLPKLRCRSI
jgi:hypothetical protein